MQSLAPSGVLSVFVSCVVEVLKTREVQRGDRCVGGSAEAPLAYLYQKTGTSWRLIPASLT
ncbi:MAG: hypothetical protein ACOYI3_05265 [Christensenellales bacterium]